MYLVSFQSLILDLLPVRHFRKISNSDHELRHVRGSVRPHAKNSAPTRQIFTKFTFQDFPKIYPENSRSITF